MNSVMDLLHAALAAADRAAAFLRTVEVPDPTAWIRKGRADFVTAVDRDAEQLIRETLEAHVPGIPMMGEELTPARTADRLTWIVDPLDGTTNFLHGYPAWSVSIAAVEGDLVLAGVVAEPMTGSVYRAARGAGAWAGDQRLAVSTLTHPGDALIGTGFPFKHPERMDAYLKQFRRILSGSAGVRRAGSAALDLAAVAAGRFDGFWELHLAPWDVAAGILLIQEAGGVVTDVEGCPHRLGHGPLVAGNPSIHTWLQATIAEAGSG